MAKMIDLTKREERRARLRRILKEGTRIGRKAGSKVISVASKVPRKISQVSQKTYKNIAKEVSQVQKDNRKVAKTLAEGFKTRKLTSSEKALYRKAMAARKQAQQYQSTQALQQTGWDNKYERQLVEKQMRIDEEERKRRFTEVPRNFLARKDAIRQEQIRRAREYQLRNNLLDAHKSQFKVNLNLLGVDPICNLAKSKPIWSQDNPDNNVFRDTGRPTILDTPNRFAVTPQTQQMNILNAQKLNFGKVDTSRRPRRQVYQRPEDDY